jgi:hypothetical protein
MSEVGTEYAMERPLKLKPKKYWRSNMPELVNIPIHECNR